MFLYFGKGNQGVPVILGLSWNAKILGIFLSSDYVRGKESPLDHTLVRLIGTFFSITGLDFWTSVSFDALSHFKKNPLKLV